jgi:hypothetical protein
VPILSILSTATPEPAPSKTPSSAAPTPTGTAIPTATWAGGYFGGMMPEHPGDPLYISCWTGYFGDNILLICSGADGRDIEQGVLLIRVSKPDRVTIVSDDRYNTPAKIGAMYIKVADSKSVTIASYHGQDVYSFDIATRRWSSLPPIPTPTSVPWTTGFVDCGLNDCVGCAVRTYTSCWQGLVNGYEVSVGAGNEVARPTGKSFGLECTTQGFYGVGVYSPSEGHLVFINRFYPSCYTLHIISGSGSVLTFQDETGAIFIVDIAQYIPPAVPTHTAAPAPSPTLTSKQLTPSP